MTGTPDTFDVDDCMAAFTLFLNNIRNHTTPDDYQQFLLQVQEYLGPNE